MGVSGSGKTTIGALLSADTGWAFLDGDDFHSGMNKTKMAAGLPLTDEDREPWLAALHEQVALYARNGDNLILACSALRKAYRDVLRGDLGSVVTFALLAASPKALIERLAERRHEFMNPSLLSSQLATLEGPDSGWIIPADQAPDDALESLKVKLRAAGAIA